MFYNLTKEQREIIDGFINQLIPLDGHNILRLKAIKELAYNNNDAYADNLLTVHKIITSKQKALEKNLLNIYLVIYDKYPDVAKQYSKKLLAEIIKINAMTAKLKSAVETKDVENELLNQQLNKQFINQLPAVHENKIEKDKPNPFAQHYANFIVPGYCHNTVLGAAVR